MRFIIRIILGGILLIFLGGFFWWTDLIKPLSKSENLVKTVIPKGKSVSEIGYLLEEKKVIKSSLAFKIFLLVTGNTGKIQAGEYLLNSNHNLSQIIGDLLAGPKGVWITIQEGLRREEIARKFTIGLNKEANDSFISDFLQLTANDEGYLFPDTYLVAKDITPQKIVELLKQTFIRKTEEIKQQTLPLSFSDVVIVASLVEREIRRNEEKPVVAGIIYKRLAAGWPLQIDAALQYAVASQKPVTDGSVKYWEPLSKSDLEIFSPYNTYKNLGLPPGPICNPSEASIKAAAEPQDSSYWFYLHDNTGQIHYGKTVEDHRQNIRKYLD